MPASESFTSTSDAETIIRGRTRTLLLVVGHSGHVMGCWVAAQGVHGGVVHGDEIAHHDAHGAVTQEFSRSIVVGGGNFENVACGKLVAALVEEQDSGHAEKFAVVVSFGVESFDGFFA